MVGHSIEDDNTAVCPHCKVEEKKNCSNRSLLKWTFALTSGLILLGLLVWSKISFLSLAEAMHDDDDLGLQSRCRIFVMLQIILCIPNALNFLRGLWNGICKTNVDWKIYVAVAVISLCETAGICIYTFIIPGYNKTHNVILLMSCALFFPTFSHITRFWKTKRNGNALKCDWCKFGFGIAMEIAAVIITLYRLFTIDAPAAKRLLTFFAIIPLSLSWMPCLRRTCVDQFKKNVCRNVKKASVWKLTAIMSFFNLVFTIGGSCLIFFTGHLQPLLSSSNVTVKVDIHNYLSGWDWTEWKQATDHEILLFVTHILSGIAGYTVACIICKANLHKSSFVAPLILSAPLAFIILVLQGPCAWILVRKGRATHLEDCVIGNANEPKGIGMNVAAILLFILAHLFVSGWKLLKTDYLKHLTEEQIFRLPTFNSVFLDSWLLLNGQNKEDDKTEHMEPIEVAKRTKVYICTTMYHEAAKELKQYIKSILNIEKAQSISKRNIEVHIFFDDAVTNNGLNDYVVNLVKEVKTILYCNDEMSWNAFKTPYGRCLSFKPKAIEQDTKIPFMIHLKDASKVKKKKRWSQVMYMTYVLECLLKRRVKTQCSIQDLGQGVQTNATIKERGQGVQTQGNIQDIQEQGQSVQTNTTIIEPGQGVQTQGNIQDIQEQGQSVQTNTTIIEPGQGVQTQGNIQDIQEQGQSVQTNTTIIEPGQGVQTQGNIQDIQEQGQIVNIDPEMESYLLVTDGDVTFTSDSVEYLLDLVMRDDTLGAVCARTHPRGNGPLYWYQIFEYAVGHWFQKAAEHILGTVLCAPGCFSIYRCKAVREVLNEYATDVKEAFEFLIKDMGEDRWFCTLMVQKGWFIEYCAAAKTETQCPENFEEFFKQRRRWLASTVANMLLLIKDWNKIKKENHRVSRMFQLYQVLLLFASLIGPSSTILVVSGGLKYGWDWNIVPTLVLQVIVSFGFGIACLFTSQGTQIKVAKLLTFLYAIVMTAVAVGMAVEITTEFINVPEAEPNFISHNIRISTFTVFLSTVIGMFLLTGILHIKEVGSLFHGLWYFLCLPVGFVLLPIYSICNITDRSWGTREIQTQSNSTTNAFWLEGFRNVFSCFPCMNTKRETVEERNIVSTSSVEIQTEDDATFREETNCEEIHSEICDDEKEHIRELLENQNQENVEEAENTFWETKINQKNLKPNQSDHESKQKLAESLAELRNSWLLIFTAANMLWLTLMATLAYKGDVLNVFGSNPVGLVVLVILMFLLTIQFIAMLIHRLSTLIQHVGRASYLAFAFSDKDMPSKDLKQKGRIESKINFNCSRLCPCCRKHTQAIEGTPLMQNPT